MGFQLHALKTDPLGLPHGNFYAPSRFTFFMDEPVLGTGLLVLPLSWFTDDAILLFNLARLLTWVLTGLFTWRLGRDIGLDPPAALATGAFFAFSPIRVDQLAHLSTLGTQWIPLVYLFARRFCIEPTVADAARTGLFFALSFLACGYHGLFFAVLLPVSLIPFLFGPQVKAILVRGGWAVVVAAVFLYPLYALSREALGAARFRPVHRGHPEVRGLARDLPRRQPLEPGVGRPDRELPRRSEQPLPRTRRRGPGRGRLRPASSPHSPDAASLRGRPRRCSASPPVCSPLVPRSA